jgi:hypothetical protein
MAEVQPKASQQSSQRQQQEARETLNSTLCKRCKIILKHFFTALHEISQLLNTGTLAREAELSYFLKD